MLKIIGAVLVVVGCSLVGILLDIQEKKRIEELDKLVTSLGYLKGEIQYRLTPLGEACEIVGHQITGPAAVLFTTFALQMESRAEYDLYKLWYHALEEMRPSCHLKEEDLKLISEFGKGVGVLDKSMEEANIDRFKEKLHKQWEQATKAYEKTSKMRTSMGVLAGLCLAILMI